MISTINTVLCNTDIKVFGHVTQMVDRGWVDKSLYKFGFNQIIIEWATYDQSRGINMCITKQGPTGVRTYVKKEN